MAATVTGRAGARRSRAPLALRLRTTVRYRLLPSTAFQFGALTVLAVAITFASISASNYVPLSAFTLVLVAGGYLLRPRELLLVCILVAIGVVVVATNRPQGNTPFNRGLVVVLVANAVVMFLVARSRARLGLQGTVGESMLVDLRDRLRAQGELPALPPDWHAEAQLRSAYGDAFSGDFLVASRSTDDSRLEVVLVDVSGKGAAAGTRSLLLSGAFGGLLGSVKSADFLPAANKWLLRQRWHEGFATAIHLDLDLLTGQFRLARAGHPPAVHYLSGSGQWTLADEPSGPVLGVMDGVEFTGYWGTLERGDAVLLYTDGVVETADRDLDIGIDRMLGEAALLVRDGFVGGARRLVERARAGESDDRALVLIWRR